MPNVEDDDSLGRDLQSSLLEELGHARRCSDSNSHTRLSQKFNLISDLEVLSEELTLAGATNFARSP